jgi:hypothetical protein
LRGGATSLSNIHAPALATPTGTGANATCAIATGTIATCAIATRTITTRAKLGNGDVGAARPAHQQCERSDGCRPNPPPHELHILRHGDIARYSAWHA